MAFRQSKQTSSPLLLSQSHWYEEMRMGNEIQGEQPIFMAFPGSQEEWLVRPREKRKYWFSLIGK